VAVGLLELQGHHVETAENGEQALEKYEQVQYDVILMDVEMPVMDGIEATKAIRQREALTGRSIPIIAMTAHAVQDNRDRCLEAGMDGYVTKPICPHELFGALASLAEPAAAAPAAP
jgi:CheY-like chemotaxis protein